MCNNKKKQNLLLECIHKITDPKLRKEYLLKLKDSINKEEEKAASTIIYSLCNILERSKKDSKKPITLQDLQREIDQIKKNEINQLRA